MSDFNRYYFSLFLALVTGSACLLYGLLRQDLAVGGFGSGVLVSTVLGLTVMRSAELRLFRSFHATGFATSQQDDLTGEIIEIDPDEESYYEDSVEIEPSDVEELEFPEIPDAPLRRERSTSEPISRCWCVCGCSRRAINGESGLCGNCNRWWMQQSEKCECDFSTNDHCECGVIQHGVAV